MMKQILFLVFALALALPAFAKTEEVPSETYLRMVNASYCGFWRSINANGIYSYACSTRPTQVTVADGGDVQRAITALENKIVELERRIAELEAPKP